MEFPDEIYRDVCSIKTLYSTTEGFFNEFVKAILQEIDSKWIDNVFKKQVSQTDKIRVCCNDPNVWSTIQNILKNICKVYRKKCNETAVKCRLQGDSLCQAGEYKKAIMMYSQSIVRAPQIRNHKTPDDSTLPFAYKGRANALFRLGRYKECMNDLNMALKEKFPDALKYQIFRLMGECYKNLSERNKAQISYQVSLKLLEEQILKVETTTVRTKANKSTDAKSQKVLQKEREEIREIVSQLPMFEGENSGVWDSDLQYVREPLPEVTGAPNDKYPNASNLLKIRQSHETGRFAAAADTIEVGATIVVEEPQASLLIPRMLSSHCLHCFTRLLTPIPCNTCSGVAFCSIQCRDSAMSSYHKYECEFLGLFLGSGMSVLSHLSLRMVTQESLSFFKQLYSKLQAMKTEKESSTTVEFTKKETQYLQVQNLTTHSHLRTSQDYFRRVLMAIFLVQCLKQSDYFEAKLDREESNSFTEDEILTASIILRHLELLQFNAHEIYETRVFQPNQTRDAKSVYIGVGIYPTVALFNHECDASVTRYFNGKNIIIKTTRPLKKNDVLSENYGPHYAKKCLRDRIRELTSRYWFRCQCKACIEDWPLIEDLTQDNFKIRCTTLTCEGILLNSKSKTSKKNEAMCGLCLRKTNVNEILKNKSKIEILFDKSMDYMDALNWAKAVPLLTAYLEKLYKLGSPPCREMFLAQEALRTCYAQTGNVWVLDE